MKPSSKAMPANHRPGSTFGTPNKPSAMSALPMPQNHGYSQPMFGGNVNNKKGALPMRNPSPGNMKLPQNHRGGKGC